MTDASTPNGGRAATPPDLHTQRLGSELVWLSAVSSTIDYAQDWLRRGGPHGGVVLAGRQTQGRGRLDRSWASPEGGLWMSIITRPNLPADRAGRLGIALALAAAEAVSDETGVQVAIKWPNDLFVGVWKVGGVLVGASLEGERVTEAILSLGLNAGFSAAELPEAVRDGATTLLDATGRRHEPRMLAARVLEALEGLWPEVAGDASGLVRRWRRRDALVGREVSVGVAGNILHGVVRGIDERGALLLVSAGQVRAVTSGEVASVKEGPDENPQVRAR